MQETYVNRKTEVKNRTWNENFIISDATPFQREDFYTFGKWTLITSYFY